MQQSAVNETYQSEEFTQIFENMKGAIDKEGDEIQHQFDDLKKQMDLLERNIKKKCTGVSDEKKQVQRQKLAIDLNEKHTTKDGLDLTEDMVNMFVRFEVQRRYLNIISMEVLSMQYGQVGPSCLHPLKSSNNSIPLANLIMNGRNITLDEYMEGKNAWDDMTKKE